MEILQPLKQSVVKCPKRSLLHKSGVLGTKSIRAIQAAANVQCGSMFHWLLFKYRASIENIWSSNDLIFFVSFMLVALQMLKPFKLAIPSLTFLHMISAIQGLQS
jgi:hypothetical protein